ncbi:MAG TPA: hypothetical protein GXX72_00600 [Clostridiaceae bacterium]|nr:hypothetical protein [Clostridiaceae bacterium]
MTTYNVTIKKRNPSNDGWDTILPITTGENVIINAQGDTIIKAIDEKIPANEKGEPEGVATLDEEGQVPAEQLNNAPDPDLSNYAEKDGDYEDLRARATTKEDVGLKNVTDDEQATKIEFNKHLTNEMPHQFIDEKNNKTYVFGLRISGEGKPQIIYEEVM